LARNRGIVGRCLHANQTWTRKLSEPVIVIGRKTPIATLNEAREFILRLPEGRQARKEWQHAAKLVLEAAGGGGDVGEATHQLKFALLMAGKLDLQ
jgi:hypothetical protein